MEGNRLTLLADGPERLEALIRLIDEARRTLRVLYYIWELAFAYFDAPHAAALTMLMLVVLGVLAAVKFKLIDKRTHYR